MTTALIVAVIAIATAVWLSFRGRRKSLTVEQRARFADLAQAVIEKVMQSGESGVPVETLHAWLGTQGIADALCSEVLGGLVEGNSLAIINDRYVAGYKTMLVLMLGREGAEAALRAKKSRN